VRSESFSNPVTRISSPLTAKLWSGFFVFRAVNFSPHAHKENRTMTTNIRRDGKPGKAAPALSLDSWAVILALALSLAIWAGWITHVPW
jgi:hypothetical protein